MFDINNNILPSNDFYNHVNSNWLNKTIIPSDNMLYNTFSELEIKNLKKIKKMINKYKDNMDISDEYKKIIILYNMSYYMKKDNRAIIFSYIDTIMSAPNIEELCKIVLNLFTLNGISSICSFTCEADYNDSKNNILHIDTTDFGLPDRDYYLNDMKKDTVKDYKIFIKKYLHYFNLDYDIEQIFNIEKILANYTFTNTMKRNVLLLNNIFTIKEIQHVIPELYNDLLYFFKKININISDITKINICNPKFIINYYKLLYTCDLIIVKQYFIYLFLRKIGNFIDINTINLLFDFYDNKLSGIIKPKSAWKRAISTINNCMGMLVGKMFVNEYFNIESKNKVIYMIEIIKDEFKKKLEQNWMEPFTKKKALEKLKYMNYKVGFPDKWDNYKLLDISINNNFLINVLNCYKFNFDIDINSLYKEVNKNKWYMNPHEINAYYSPSHNEIVFPCGILEKPFFSLDMDMAQNFGGIGCIIGHEITHGFDDMGSKFDMNGDLKDWWTKKDKENYKMKSNLLIEMFNKLKIHGNSINSILTLGENIADIGGVDIAFNSLKSYYKKYPYQLTNDSYKIFFYSYANIWKCVITKEESLKKLLTDQHAPPIYRVNIILGNINDFYKIFDIKKNTPMWIDEKDRFSII